MKKSRLFVRKLIPVAVIATAFAASSVYAGSFFGGGHHRGGDMLKPIERMIDHVDLSDTQEEQANVIFENARTRSKNIGEIRHRFFKQIVDNNPDDSQYMSTAEEQAEAIATEVKNQILFMAKVRQDVYKILTAEQKEELAEHIEKKMARMNNRIEKHRR